MPSLLDCEPVADTLAQFSRDGSSPLQKLMQLMPEALAMRVPDDGGLLRCAGNCSGHGECSDGVCVCEVEFSGSACDNPNLSYHLAFSCTFFVLCAVSFVQLALCINSEFRRRKPRSAWNALRITTQKALYLLICVASAVRGLYFQAALTGHHRWASNLRSAYYPLVMSGFALIVCFWAEAFHLHDISIDRPGFLSKSFCGFALFNVITYSLFFAELFLLQYVNSPNLDRNTYLGIFNSIYASLMLVVVTFFLIYGVEMYFKLRGAFIRDEPPVSNRSQLHQSRLGLVSQAVLLIFTVIFLMSDVLGGFWKAKVPVLSRNTHQIMFQVVELALALWFPCCLWNCVRPEQLWILNPRRILKGERRRNDAGCNPDEDDSFIGNSGDDEPDGQSRLECWICYDGEKPDRLIEPCDCKGDVSAVHHECLKQWLMESNLGAEHIRCQVCKQFYNFSRGRVWLPAGFTLNHYLRSALIACIMSISFVATYCVIQLFEQVTVRTVSVGVSILIQYVCLRALGVNLISAYQRAKFAAIQISGRILDQPIGEAAGGPSSSPADLPAFQPIRTGKLDQSRALERRKKLLSFIRATLHEPAGVGQQVHFPTSSAFSQPSGSSAMPARQGAPPHAPHVPPAAQALQARTDQPDGQSVPG